MQQNLTSTEKVLSSGCDSRFTSISSYTQISQTLGALPLLNSFPTCVKMGTNPHINITYHQHISIRISFATLAAWVHNNTYKRPKWLTCQKKIHVKNTLFQNPNASSQWTPKALKTWAYNMPSIKGIAYWIFLKWLNSPTELTCHHLIF